MIYYICTNMNFLTVFDFLYATMCQSMFKKAFCKMYVTICGRFCPDEGVVAGYGNRIRAKHTAKWGVQIAGMIFQTRSSTVKIKYLPHWRSI